MFVRLAFIVDRFFIDAIITKTLLNDAFVDS